MLEIFSKGGPVVWILLGYSVIALAIVIERIIHFQRMSRISPANMIQLQEKIKSNQMADLAGHLRGPEAVMINNLLQACNEGVKDLVRVATRTGSQELQRIERGFRTLALLGDTAPLLGLLGTISGMIKAFMVIEQAGGKVDAQALAGGIWEAMVTTGVGLAVALPVLFLLHWLEGLASQRALAMQQIASLIIESSPNASGESISGIVHHHKEISYGI